MAENFIPMKRREYMNREAARAIRAIIHEDPRLKSTWLILWDDVYSQASVVEVHDQKDIDRAEGLVGSIQDGKLSFYNEFNLPEFKRRPKMDPREFIMDNLGKTNTSTDIEPDHYEGNKGDLLDAFEGYILTHDEMIGAYKFNVIKYMKRFDKKNQKQDLEKARYYINRLMRFEYGDDSDEED